MISIKKIANELTGVEKHYLEEINILDGIDT